MSSSSLYEIDLTMNDGTPKSFGDFRGRPVLVVNVASKCGFTPQYAGLEELYSTYAERGLVVLGMPSNQFMGQEPLNDGEIAEFCSTTFGVTFPLMAKGDVRGKDQHPLYRQLTKYRNGVLPGLVKWNFEKFLVNRDGEIVARFAPTVEPDAPEVIAAIEAVLAQSA
ncbi:glutathione peroxidase [Arthrobacter agilis]|uniref:glutathione peroxidase n=1 Tax=Arthrobacter agilis TaxID=37921 RepID=UPI000B351096|nr:glutathione peroxidase [Arthrobacter agilis]OUM43670.1 glutathione peroxidase [Arthrobacter agilis]PPB46743.1 glutathione peroxidase [Arthrobacter agilis]TPV24915.1 glutathione peroxidase [Arthrobacter agilis]WDF33678.1 glutathione peroxidase [Arthrobacter agilis]VDR31082.1 Glutathione peroxidase homolog BsaA [Arthrobacter agilis]